MLLVAIVTGGLLILFSVFSPWGIEKMILPFPTNFGNWWDEIYLIAFFFFYVIFLPMGEEAFFRVFLSEEWKDYIPDLVICLAYAPMNYVALICIINTAIPRLIFAAITLLLAFLLVYLRDKFDKATCLVTRIGLALGIVFWIFYLYETVKHEFPRKQPEYFFRANVDNIWNKIS
jgi:membrane protease YdiL (CAAX protease family)